MRRTFWRRVTACTSTSSPSRRRRTRPLENIYDPPCLLYWQGHLPAFDEEAAIAVVGTRSNTPYGVACAEKLGYGLAAGGALVVSGLARGIDSAALRGALRAGKPAVGVTGGGLDVFYPRENQYLYEDIAAAGVLISEYPPGTEPKGALFRCAIASSPDCALGHW